MTVPGLLINGTSRKCGPACFNLNPASNFINSYQYALAGSRFNIPTHYMLPCNANFRLRRNIL